MTISTCGQCRAWVRVEQQQIVLGAPRQGDCRAMPPAVNLVMAQGPGGQAALQSVVSYPSVPENFPACGLGVAQSGQAKN